MKKDSKFLSKTEAKAPCQWVIEIVGVTAEVTMLCKRESKRECPFKTSLKRWKEKIMNILSEMLLFIN